MRILFISTIFPHPANPVCGTFNLEICRALALQHEVHVIAPRSWIENARSRSRLRTTKSELKDWSEESLGMKVTHPTYYYPPKVLRRYYGSFMWHSVRGEIKRVQKEFSPDCVVSYWAHPDGEVGLLAAREAGVPAAVIVGGSDVLILTENPARRRRVLRVLHDSEAVVTISDGLRNRVIDLGVSPDRAHTVYQGVNPEVFFVGEKYETRRRLGLPLDRKILIWVGRIVPIKGLDTLVDTCSKMKQSNVDFDLYLVGDGPGREELESHIGNRGLSDSIHCVGPVEHRELSDWYRAADLMVMSSVSEGLPNVLRESLACGTGFVATDVGSISEIADPRYSMLVPPRDSNAMAMAIEAALLSNLSDAARNYVPRTWKNTANTLEKLLQDLGSEKRSDVETNEPLQVVEA